MAYGGGKKSGGMKGPANAQGGTAYTVRGGPQGGPKSSSTNRMGAAGKGGGGKPTRSSGTPYKGYGDKRGV